MYLLYVALDKSVCKNALNVNVNGSCGVAGDKKLNMKEKEKIPF